MVRCLLFLTLLMIHTIVNAQFSKEVLSTGDGGGIDFEKSLSWKQTLAKAKEENKFIFIDAFASWCGPCKKMDREVYVNDTVGNYFNDKFISIKVQMDKTKNDNAFVQSWYADAAALNKQYRVQGYPSLIFLSPSGIIVHQVLGYQSVKELIAVAQTATKPGQVYVDPFAEYDQLVTDYRKGIKNYDKMPYMIKTAYQLGEKELGKIVMDEHTEYVATLPKQKRYTKDAIELWSGFLLGSDKKRFWFFYNDGDLIDKVMNKKGYAQEVVSRTIQEEIVWPFLKEQSAGSKVVVSPETMNLIDKSQKPDYSEAAWNKLYKAIRKKYNKMYSDKNLLEAKIKWYERHKNYNAATKLKLKKMENEPPDLNNPNSKWDINSVAWNTFLFTTEKDLINRALRLLEKVVKYAADTSTIGSDLCDTYANLLYKAGWTETAIEWEQRAVRFAEKIPELKQDVIEFNTVINKMKEGEPTYVDRGAIWPQKKN
ncbi:thioredoxin family protein [Niastella sp. OAS944]|uniref:thioredoxin family protein n=1 Tax=Niastella sp. OAS944 TaxID=2664089 RepID=UPI003472CD51|nr:thioredoxin-related protein [Chitinophagaceae bacterium OAS944]